MSYWNIMGASFRQELENVGQEQQEENVTPFSTKISDESSSEARLDSLPLDQVLSGERLDGDGPLTIQVYRLIRKLIVELRLMPNQFLSEKDVAKSLDISKTPVREAFIRLSEDGMLRIVPQSGTYVSPIDINRASEGYFIWSALEAACAAQVAVKRSLEDVHYLRSLVEEQREALSRDDYLAFYAADDMLHAVMFRIAGYPNARRLIETAKFEVDRIRSLKKRYRLRPVAEVQAEHAEIVNAIADGDADTAGRRMARHLARVNDSLVELVKDEKLWTLFQSLNNNGHARRRSRKAGRG